MVFEMSANVLPFGTAFGDGQFSTAGTRINILNFSLLRRGRDYEAECGPLKPEFSKCLQMLFHLLIVIIRDRIYIKTFSKNGYIRYLPVETITDFCKVETRPH